MSIAGALMELFGSEMDEYIDGRTRDAVERGRVQQLIRTARRHGAADEDIIAEISQEFGCTLEDAGEKIKELDILGTAAHPNIKY